MSENLHDIDELFRGALDENEEMPSGKVWDALDNDLDKSNVIQIKRKYNNLKRIAVALLLLLLGTIIYEIQSKKAGKQELANNSVKEKIKDSGTNPKTKNTNDPSLNTGGSNSTAVNNAGIDSSANKVHQAAQIPVIKTTTGTLFTPTAETISGISRPIDKKDIANRISGESEPGKSLVKKASAHKMSTGITNGVVAEDLAEEKNDKENTAGKNPVNNGSANELTALQHAKVEKIFTSFSKDELTMINGKRISPDADLPAVKNKHLKSAKPFHLNVTAFYAPQFSFNRLEDDRPDSGPQGPPLGNGREEIKKDEQYERSSSLGVSVEIPVGKKWNLQSGISYLNKEISIEPKKIFAKLDNDGKVKYRFDCSSGYTYISPKSGTTPAVGDSVNAAASTNTLQYIGIPLGVNYTFSIGKFNIIPGFGTAANFLVKQKIETELIQGSSKEKQIINNIKGMKSIYFNAFTGISLEYNFSQRMAVNVTPSGNFALSSINKNAAVKSYPNSFAIGAGIKIKF